jgi:hypothetical protein
MFQIIYLFYALNGWKKVGLSSGKVVPGRHRIGKRSKWLFETGIVEEIFAC